MQNRGLVQPKVPHFTSKRRACSIIRLVNVQPQLFSTWLINALYLQIEKHVHRISAAHSHIHLFAKDFPMPITSPLQLMHTLTESLLVDLDPDASLALMAPDVIGCGTGDGEYVNGIDEAESYFRDMCANIPAPFSFTYSGEYESIHDTCGTAIAQMITTSDGLSMRSRCTIGVRLIDGETKICNFHYSAPEAAQQTEDEYFPYHLAESARQKVLSEFMNGTIPAEIMDTVVALDYDYVFGIDPKTGNYECFSSNPKSITPLETGTDYDSDIAVYLQEVVASDVEEAVRSLQLPNVVHQLESQEMYFFDFDLRGADGSIHRKRVHFSYVGNSRTKILKTRIDITTIVEEEKSKQRQLASALAQANRANQSKTVFLSHMSHDIRTPLNAIIGLNALAQEDNEDTVVAGYLDKIATSSHFLLSLINDILDTSKMEIGDCKLQPRDVPLTEFDQVINDSVRSVMEEKGIVFKYRMDCGLTCAHIDPLRFNQLFMNLLTNASKYTPKGGTVEFSATSQGKDAKGRHLVRFIVSDTGIGMPEGFAAKAFEPFEQAEQESDEQWQGTGLGLSIVRQIVDLMEGSVWIEPNPGGGTRFVVDLPLVPGKEALTDAKKDAVKESLKGINILMAEDNQLNAYIASELLKRQGATVHIVSNGEEAVEALIQADPYTYQVMLMDIRMPKLNGLEATKNIRSMGEEGRNIPIIALTANAFSEDIDAAMNAGMNGYLSKPIDAPVMFSTIANLVSKKGV